MSSFIKNEINTTNHSSCVNCSSHCYPTFWCTLFNITMKTWYRKKHTFNRTKIIWKPMIKIDIKINLHERISIFDHHLYEHLLLLLVKPFITFFSLSRNDLKTRIQSKSLNNIRFRLFVQCVLSLCRHNRIQRRQTCVTNRGWEHKREKKKMSKTDLPNCSNKLN